METKALSADDLMCLLSLEARASPLTRFLAALTGPARKWADETLRLERELKSHFTRCFSSTDIHESVEYARLVQNMVVEVTYRRASLMRALERWLMFDIEAVRIIINKDGVEDGAQGKDKATGVSTRSVGQRGGEDRAKDPKD